MGIEEILSALVPLVFFGLWVLGQLAGRANQKPNAPPPANPQRPPAAGGADPADEVEAFLRKVAQRRAAGDANAPQPAQRRQPPRPRPQPAAQRPAQPRQPQPVRQLPEAELIAAEEVVAVDEVRELRERHSVDDHVSDHLRERRLSEDFETRSKVDDADDKMAAHQQDVFDHKMGRLSSTDESRKKKKRQESKAASAKQQVKSTPTRALAIAEMLRNPESVRSAVVLSEIFRRPSDSL